MLLAGIVDSPCSRYEEIEEHDQAERTEDQSVSENEHNTLLELQNEYSSCAIMMAAVIQRGARYDKISPSCRCMAGESLVGRRQSILKFTCVCCRRCWMARRAMGTALANQLQASVEAPALETAAEPEATDETAASEEDECLIASNAVVTAAAPHVEDLMIQMVSEILDVIVVGVRRGAAADAGDEERAEEVSRQATNPLPVGDCFGEEVDSSQDHLRARDGAPAEGACVVLEILESLVSKVADEGCVQEKEAEKRASAQAAWREIEAEMDAATRRNEAEALAREKSADEAAERRRQEEAERMALARTAVMMQKLFRGKKARGFARDLRNLRLLQLSRFEEEEKKRAITAVVVLQRQVPLQVLDFRRRFHSVVDLAIEQYNDRCRSIVATPDPSAGNSIKEKILAHWASCSIANEAAIAAALVKSARVEVQKGLVLGCVMRGALERDTLVKGLEKVNSVAQDSLSAALREHLPLAPETVEERMASLKVSIDAKKRLQAYVEIECDKVMRQMEELTRPGNSDAPLLLDIMANSHPGSALRVWDPLSHLPAGDLHARVLKSRERAEMKGSIRLRSRACQQRWRALGANLDNSRQAFTDRVLGTSGGRGWDPVSAKAACNSAYAADLAGALSHLSPPCSAETHSNRSDDTRILKRRIALLFAPKLARRHGRQKHSGEAAALKESQWRDWEPGRFRRKPREPRRPEFGLQTDEANLMTHVDVGVPLSPTELKRRAQLAKDWGCDLKPITVLPEIVHQNFQHSLKKLENEVSLRRGDRAGAGRYTSLSNREERWDKIRQISRLEEVPVKELFATPRRLQK